MSDERIHDDDDSRLKAVLRAVNTDAPLPDAALLDALRQRAAEAFAAGSIPIQSGSPPSVLNSSNTEEGSREGAETRRLDTGGADFLRASAPSREHSSVFEDFTTDGGRSVGTRISPDTNASASRCRSASISAAFGNGASASSARNSALSRESSSS